MVSKINMAVLNVVVRNCLCRRTAVRYELAELYFVRYDFSAYIYFRNACM